MRPPEAETPGEKLYESWDCPQVVAKHSYESDEPDVLQLELGDVVNVSRKLPDGEWPQSCGKKKNKPNTFYPPYRLVPGRKDTRWSRRLVPWKLHWGTEFSTCPSAESKAAAPSAHLYGHLPGVAKEQVTSGCSWKTGIILKSNANSIVRNQL